MTETDLLKDLNDEQKQAVTHTDGPLLVVAGAGTGKTTVIARRIAWLIQKKLAKPPEILALTFTEKAAGEMESRVDQLVPYGYTATTIATFHAFGDQILREHALELDLPPEYRVLGSDEQLLFLGDRFNDIPDLTVLRPVTNPRKYLANILRSISRAKDELVTPATYTKTAAKLRKNAQDEEAIEEAERHIEIARIYTAYEDFKNAAGVIDFGDQILKFIELLKKHRPIRQQFQDRFRFILVDEFQDTNTAQYQLVKELLGAHHNLTVVGDDDQAIYKFRGAAISNILHFLEDYPKAKTVVLTNNYRSRQKILDAAYTLIQHNNPDRLESKLNISKRLKGQTDGSQPMFLWYIHEADELDGLIEAIRSERLTTPLRSMAILVRSNATIGPIATALSRASLDFTVSTDHSFTHRPEIRGMIAFFQVLAHPTDALATLKLGLSPFFKLKPEWLLVFNDLERKTHRDILSLLEDETNDAWQSLGDKGQTALRDFRDSLSRYRSLIGEKNPGEILYQFLRDRGVLHAEPSQKAKGSGQLSLFTDVPEEEKYLMIQNIATVFEAIKSYIDAGRDRFALTFVDQLESLLGTIVPPTLDLGPDKDAIAIMTVHAAKGLEFQTVFLPYLTSDVFPSRRKSEPLALPEALIAETLPAGDEHLAEERRLFYVALTRAKEHLYLSGAQKTGNGVRIKKISPFVIETISLTGMPQPIERVASERRLHAFAPILPTAPTLKMPSYDGTLFLSPAMIETYNQDPYNFYWRYVLKAPQPPNPYVIYGTAIHAAIEAYYRLRKTGKNPTLADLLERFYGAWKSEGFSDLKDEQRRQKKGEATIARFIQRAKTESLPDFVEEEFTLTLPGVRIKGRIDAIWQSTGVICDFKTSTVKSQKEADTKAKDNLPIRIYALAYKARFRTAPKSLILDFVEHNLQGQRAPTDQLLAETETLIAETVESINAGRFEPNLSNPYKDYE